MSKRLNRFLIVDAAEEASTQFSRVAQRLGYSTETAASLPEFIVALTEFQPSVVMLDLQSIEQGGLDHLKAMRDHESAARIILTSESDTRTLETATQLAEFLGLPVVASLRTSIFVNLLRDELRRARQSRTDVKLDDLEKALERNEIRPVYQPNATLGQQGDWSITDVEVFPHWQLNDSTVVAPDDFVWLAENSGLMPTITNALLEQALQQCAEWQQRKIDVNVAVNLPASSLADRRFPDALAAMIRKRNFDPARLTLEVAEANVMNYSSSVVEVLGRLKSMGCRLSIDEFGTSYSSLEQLYRLKFDELKIDRALIRESRSGSDARTIIEATVLLAHKMGLEVCAEGVDSQRTLQFLGRIGCNKAQGKLIGGAQSADALEENLREWNVSAQAS